MSKEEQYVKAIKQGQDVELGSIHKDRFLEMADAILAASYRVRLSAFSLQVSAR